MESIKLNNGVNMPLIGLGTWQMTGQECFDSVYHAIKSGYKHIDTAKYYGNEIEVGKAIKKAIKDLRLKRSDIFVTTKLWNTDQSNPIDAFNESLKRLDIEYIDLYLIHWPMPQRLSAWKSMQELIKTKKVRALGVSNFTIEHIKEIIENKLPLPQVNQIEFSPFLYQKELLDFCNKNNIVLVAYSPLTRGKKLNDQKIKEISKKYNKTPAQLILRWCIQHSVPTIPKSANKQRIEENADIFDFKINKEDMKLLDDLNEGFYSFMNFNITLGILKFARSLGF